MGQPANPLARSALARRLKKLAADMHETGVIMETAGGFDASIVQHAHELQRASAIARDWAREIEPAASA